MRKYIIISILLLSTLIASCGGGKKTTKEESLIPQIIKTEPSAGVVGVSIKAPILVEFNTPMNRSSVEKDFKMIPASLREEPRKEEIEGKFQWKVSGESFIFIPDDRLDSGRSYRVSIGEEGLAESEDKIELSAYEWIFTTEGNIPPEAIAKISPTEGNAPLGIHCEGIGKDKDGSVISYAWDFGDGTRSYGVMNSHIYTEERIYEIILTVEDDKGAIGISDPVRILVLPPPMSPLSPVSSLLLTIEKESDRDKFTLIYR